MRSVTMSELEVALDPRFKGGQGWGGGDSLREAVPLRDGGGGRRSVAGTGFCGRAHQRSRSWSGGGSSSGFL